MRHSIWALSSESAWRLWIEKYYQFCVRLDFTPLRSETVYVYPVCTSALEKQHSLPCRFLHWFLLDWMNRCCRSGTWDSLTSYTVGEINKALAGISLSAVGEAANSAGFRLLNNRMFLLACCWKKTPLWYYSSQKQMISRKELLRHS